MAKIKLYATCYWQDDVSLYNYLTIYSGSPIPVWKNIEFTLSQKYDYKIIFTAPYRNHKIDNIESTILFNTEPPQSSHHILQNGIYKSKMYCPEIFWGFTKKDVTIVKKGKFAKNKCFSSVTSELSFLEGHQKRLMFIYYLDKIFVEGFHLYGRKYSGNYFNLINSYKGEIPNKLLALINYKYNFACENSFIYDYFTEKILQPILTGTLCFYDGCINICEYVRPESFIKLDINDPEKSIEIIIKSIQDDVYSQKKKHIMLERMRILERYNILNIVWAEVNGIDLNEYFKL